jgi:hypothetical protein
MDELKELGKSIRGMYRGKYVTDLSLLMNQLNMLELRVEGMLAAQQNLHADPPSAASTARDNSAPFNWVSDRHEQTSAGA